MEPEKGWFFIADAHLSEADELRQQMLVRFLEENRDRMACLVILGDLFDFWFGFPGYLDPAYRPLCDVLTSLSRDGVRIIYLEGNHDFSMGEFFTETLQGKVCPGDHVLELNGYRVFLSHGDNIDPGDFRYRFYRGLLKSRSVYTLIRLFGPGRTRKVKNFFNRREWMHRRKEHSAGVRPDEAFARKKFEEGMDVVILGHIHHPCEKTFVLHGRTCYYFNVGDWIEHFSYLWYHPRSGFRLEYYRQESLVSPEKGQGLS
ncbi:MAG: UDP-2,3-diacylglucosamine diphosphatase [bacterium]